MNPVLKHAICARSSKPAKLSLLTTVLLLLCAPSPIHAQANINNVLYVGNGITTWGTGDIGSQINTAYAALPGSGGTIVVVPQTTGACYSFSTPITFTTLHKYVSLKDQLSRMICRPVALLPQLHT